MRGVLVSFAGGVGSWAARVCNGKGGPLPYNCGVPLVFSEEKHAGIWRGLGATKDVCVDKAIGWCHVYSACVLD